MNNFDQIKNALQRIRHFNDLPDEIQQGIAASAIHRHFDTGQVIYVDGEPAESIYILEAGWVKATRMTRDGREQAMMFLHPVEVFGDIAVFTGTTYPGTVVALEDVDVWVIPAKTILDLIPRHALARRTHHAHGSLAHSVRADRHHYSHVLWRYDRLERQSPPVVWLGHHHPFGYRVCRRHNF